MTSSTVVQKHVGHTIVQLPQVRQRSATSSQRGCSRLAEEQVADARGVHLAAHLLRRRGRVRGTPPRSSSGPRRRRRELRQHVRALLAAGLDDEVVAVVEHLGERQVEARVRSRPRAHRDAEARPARLAAVHGDDERSVTGTDAVEDRHRVQLARPHADEGVARAWLRLLELGQRAVLAEPGAPQPHLRRQLELLPRVRPDGVAEQRVVVAALAAGSGRRPARRSSRPAGRRSSELVVDDRAVGDRRTDDGVAAALKRREEPVERRSLEPHGHEAEPTCARARTHVPLSPLSTNRPIERLVHGFSLLVGERFDDLQRPARRAGTIAASVPSTIAGGGDREGVHAGEVEAQAGHTCAKPGSHAMPIARPTSDPDERASGA